MEPSSLVEAARTLDCIHCGLCLNTCPTYRLTGVESAGPRGRVHLMRAVAEGELEADAGFAEEMNACLLCRHCESVCPSGIRMGTMMEFTRGGLERHGRRPLWSRAARWLGFRLVLPRRGLVSVLAGALRLAQRSGLVRLAPALLGSRGAGLPHLPGVPPASERGALPARTPAQGETHGRVGVLDGCVMPILFGRVNRATVRVLAACGFEVHSPPRATCCGSLHAHNGDLEAARSLARGTIAAHEDLLDLDGTPAPIVVNSAGCGSHMKEYGELLADDPAWSRRARDFAARVVDFSEHLAASPDDLLDAALSGRSADLAGPVVWDDPCHLCHGQGVRDQPRSLLDRVSGAERVDLAESESCCGSAGVYSLTHPEPSAAILDERLTALAATGAKTLVTANPGCQLQWAAGVRRAGLEVEVLHLAEVLGRALDD
ncbi:MAG: heterodisulfide reductase-related iron-sulfur binding cluster [Planctomycetota bacterium]|nr:heterodisulfide reductase-related iron-sulfur binding cluster [Planctomycetota bacterium]MDP6761813.1 heterodisulfide reductase-related iron-sulfur binding cluster [Planctomycetota bacterium]MDP6988859.1 heterodisulfide reductase-related iron-sulfur binding cluster [Planctomycetota bacterium]